MAAPLFTSSLLSAAWVRVACGTEHPKASQDCGSTLHRSWGPVMTGQCFQPVEGLLLPSLMTAAGRGSLHDRGCSRPSVPDAGARERLRRGDVPTPPLLTSRSWCFSSPSVSSLRAEQLKAASFTVPRPSFCRSEGGTAKPCVCLRSRPAKKPVLGLGKMCPSSRPPGAAVQAAAAGDRAGRARGGAHSWMKRKEVFICCCSGLSAISCDGAGLVLAGVKLRSQCPGMQTLAAVGRRDLAPWIHWQPEEANDTPSAPRGNLQGAEVREWSWLWDWTLHSLHRITETDRLVENIPGARGGRGWSRPDCLSLVCLMEFLFNCPPPHI